MSRVVTDNQGDGRFELRVDGELVGWSEYRPAGESVILAHTEIDERREGQGRGSVLVEGVLDHIRASGKTVIPSCTFTAAYIRRHPEYVELVDPSLRGPFASPRCERARPAELMPLTGSASRPPAGRYRTTEPGP